MKHRPCLCLLLVGALGLGRPAGVSAQTIRPRSGPSRTFAGNTPKPLAVPLPQRHSHRRLSDFPSDLSGAEEIVGQRLQTAGRLRAMQDLIRKFHDPKYLAQLRAEARVGQDEFAALRRKIQGGKKFADDRAWKKILERVRTSDQFMPDDVDLLNEWAARRPDVVPDWGPGIRPPDPATPPPGHEEATTPQPGPMAPPGPGGESAPRPENFWDWSGKQMQDATKELITSVSDAFDSDDTPDGRSLRNAIRQFGRGNFKGSGFGLDLTKYAPGLSGYLPNWRKFVPLEHLSPHGFASLFRGTGLPRMPRFRERMFPAVPHGSGSRLGEGLLWCLVLLALGAVGWKALRHYRAAADGRSGRHWRLGPWPVDPGAVSTRAELVAAFEHLAFLRLGLPARACNHREVAQRLAENAGGQSRRAAEELARIYEQARYTPGDEALSPENLAAARRDLCYLAGVARA